MYVKLLQTISRLNLDDVKDEMQSNELEKKAYGVYICENSSYVWKTKYIYVL